MKGLPIQGYFSFSGTKGESLVTMVPSGRRTVTAVAFGERIMTPSITA